MGSEASSDQELKKRAEEFFAAAWKARCKTDEEAKVLFGSPLGFRLIEKALFSNGPEVQKPLNELVRRCIKVLGPKAGHEEDIKEVAWKQATKISSDDVKPAAAAFTATLDALGTVAYVYVAPNYVIQFGDGIHELAIGPVKARMSQDIVNEINGQKLHTMLHAEVGQQPGLSFEGNKILFTLAAVSWEVTVNASQGNVPEEASWLINVALSLLRLTYPQSHPSPLFPNIGENEPYPTILPQFHDPSLVRNNGKIKAGGGSLPHRYTIDKDVISHLTSKGFGALAEEIFKHKPQTVAERVAQGLGWMTRGRQAQDRAERFLFFFTAVEALLSSGDKTAPVTQTIARHAATILLEKPSDRHGLAREILKSYETRSMLVHGGRRNVSNLEATDAQILAEALYWHVLEKLPLTTSQKDFEAGLKEASYGLTWPL